VFRRQEMQEKDKKYKRRRKALKPIWTLFCVQKTINAREREEMQKKMKDSKSHLDTTLFSED